MAAPKELVRDYIDSGRQLQDVDDATLFDMWRSAAKDGAKPDFPVSERPAVLTVLNYVEAELSLRGLAPPPPRGKKDLH